MRCPFLREAQVKSCQASPFRKMIVRGDETGGERCTSDGWRECPAARQLSEEHPSRARCPFLHESLVQYCGAAPVARYVPYSESAFSLCGGDSHRYCEAYLGVAGSPAPPAAGRAPAGSAWGIPVPGWLWFAPNHTWLDETEDGTCHVGIDAFLVRILSPVDRVQFLTTSGIACPAALVGCGPLDVTVVFPNPLILTGVNGGLRAAPGRLAADPYGLGWLFAGRPARRETPATAGLRRGAAAVEWMESEVVRLRETLEGPAGRPAPGEARLAADGGLPAEGLARLLPRPEALALLHALTHAR